MQHEKILQLDPIIHAPNRLAVMSILITVENAKFTFLKESIGITDGNLTTHLTKLEKNGLITIKKKFVGKKPQTTCAVTEKGRQAFKTYLETLEQIISGQKEK